MKASDLPGRVEAARAAAIRARDAARDADARFLFDMVARMTPTQRAAELPPIALRALATQRLLYRIADTLERCRTGAADGS